MSGKGRMALLGVLVIALVGTTQAALAHFQTGVYTWSKCGSGGHRVDPINIVFYSWGNTAQTVEQIVHHAGWTNSSGSSQSFKSHGSCGAMQAQRASGGLVSSRYHIRLRQTPHTVQGLGTTTVGDAHHEDLVIPCGHAVDKNGSNGSGFDQGRRTLRTEFSSAGHAWSSVYWGNTQNFKQCDDDYAGSDGWVVFVKIHSNDH